MSKQNKNNKQNKVTEKKQTLENQKQDIQETPFDKFTLMPELEELVKKNPNRNIGCGG